MTQNSATAAATSTPAIGMRGEIAMKWSKFTEQDVTALKTKDDLVAQVVQVSVGQGPGAEGRRRVCQGPPAVKASAISGLSSGSLSDHPEGGPLE